MVGRGLLSQEIDVENKSQIRHWAIALCEKLNARSSSRVEAILDAGNGLARARTPAPQKTTRHCEND